MSNQKICSVISFISEVSLDVNKSDLSLRSKLFELRLRQLYHLLVLLRLLGPMYHVCCIHRVVENSNVNRIIVQ